MGQDIATLGAKVDPSGVQAGTAKANAALERMRRKGLSATKSLGTGFKGLRANIFSLRGAIIGLGMAAFARDIIKTGVAFEHSMVKVGGIMRATESEMKSLTALAREMGETTEFKATQAASGLEFLGMAGFSAVEAMTALPGVLDLATAGQIDLGRAADIASNALTAMQLPVEELTRVNDVFVATITSANTNMEMLAESFKYVAPLAAGLGFEIEEVSAYIGLLGNAGIQGSMAGTQLAFAMQKLQKGFDLLGVSAIDSQGGLRGVVEFMEELEEANMDSLDATNLMIQAFGQRGGKGMLALFSQGSEVIREYIAEINESEGRSKDLARTMRDDLKGALDELASVIESVKIDAMTKDSSELEDSIRNLTNTIRDNKEELAELAAIFVKIATGLASMAAASAGKLGGVVEMVERTASLAGLFAGGEIDFWTWVTANDVEAREILERFDDKMKGIIRTTEELNGLQVGSVTVPFDPTADLIPSEVKGAGTIPEGKDTGATGALARLSAEEREALIEKMNQLTEFLYTEEEAISASYEARIGIVESSLEARLIGETRANELIADLQGKMSGELVAKELEDAERDRIRLQGKLDNLAISLMSEEELIQENFLRKQGVIDEAMEQRIINQLEHDELILSLVTERDENELARLTAIEKAKTKILNDENKKKVISELAYAKIKGMIQEGLVGLLRQFSGKSKMAALALIAIDKARAIASITIDTQAAVMKTMASLPYPANMAAAGQVRLMGNIARGLVLATGFAEAANALAPSSSAGGGGGTFDSPMITESADTTGGGAQVIIHANFSSLDLDDTNRSKMVDSIKELMDEIFESTNGHLSKTTVILG